MKQDSITKLLVKVFKMYNISVTDNTIEQAILSHPSYPSMHCISDVLDSWKVKHFVMRLSMKKLQALNVPVIAHIKKR